MKYRVFEDGVQKTQAISAAQVMRLHKKGYFQTHARVLDDNARSVSLSHFVDRVTEKLKCRAVNSEVDSPERSVPAALKAPTVSAKHGDLLHTSNERTVRQYGYVFGAVILAIVVVFYVTQYPKVQPTRLVETPKSSPVALNEDELMQQFRSLAVRIDGRRRKQLLGFTIADGKVVCALDDIKAESLDDIRFFCQPEADSECQGQLIFRDRSAGIAVFSVQDARVSKKLGEINSSDDRLFCVTPTEPTQGRAMLHELHRCEIRPGFRRQSGTTERLQIAEGVLFRLGSPVLNSFGALIGVTLNDKHLLRVAAIKAVDQPNAVDQHQAEFITRYVNSSSGAYLQGMETLLDAWEIAIDSNIDASVLLNLPMGDGTTAIEFVQKQVAQVDPVDDELYSILKEDMKRIARNRALPEDVRKSLMQFWTNYNELKSYCSSPRGTFISFREKKQELFDEYDRCREALSVLLSIDLSSLHGARAKSARSKR